jgi:Ala-tRNA(Pro) deacylase
MVQPVPEKAQQAAAVSAAAPSVPHRIQDLLTRRNVPFDLTRHRPVYTSAEAAEVRGESLHSGAKALVVKADDHFVMLVLPGDHSLDSKLARKVLGAKSIRFASREEVVAITGLEPGSIPPFGTLFGLKTFCDTALRECEKINFNAGSHSESVRMLYVDYEAVEQPAREAFSRPAASGF